jgi:hypothetical protein
MYEFKNLKAFVTNIYNINKPHSYIEHPYIGQTNQIIAKYSFM